MQELQKLLLIKSKSVGELRLRKYRSNTKTLQRIAGKPLDAVLKNMQEVEKLAIKIRQSDYEEWTKTDLRTLLKMLWKLANGHELEDAPKEIRWLKTQMQHKFKKMPKGLITDEELTAMLKMANIRDRAIIHLFYEAGLRVGELIALNKSDVQFCKEGARVSVPDGTKTGARSILVIDCAPSLANWLNNHPLKDEKAPLFVSDFQKKEYRRMWRETVLKAIKKTARVAGIERRVYNHLFRHTAATRMAKFLTDAQMKAYFGWTQDSNMASTYIHLSGRDIDKAIIMAHGQPVKNEDVVNKLSPLICERCGRKNSHDATMCDKCGLPSDKQKAKLQELSWEQKFDDLREKMLYELLVSSKKITDLEKNLSRLDDRI